MTSFLKLFCLLFISVFYCCDTNAQNENSALVTEFEVQISDTTLFDRKDVYVSLEYQDVEIMKVSTYHLGTHKVQAIINLLLNDLTVDTLKMNIISAQGKRSIVLNSYLCKGSYSCIYFYLFKIDSFSVKKCLISSNRCRCASLLFSPDSIDLHNLHCSLNFVNNFRNMYLDNKLMSVSEYADFLKRKRFGFYMVVDSELQPDPKPQKRKKKMFFF